MRTGLQSKMLKKWCFSNEKSNNNRHKRRKMPLHLRVQIWMRYNGNKMVGRCFVCGEELSFRDMSLAHKQPLCKGGSNCPSNLVPTHHACNWDMCSMDAISYIRKYYPKRETLLRKQGLL